MNIIKIPAYSYFTGDTRSYRTDIYMLSSTAFIERMLTEHPELEDGLYHRLYRYQGNKISANAYSMINSFFNENLFPYLGFNILGVYNSNYTPQTPVSVFDNMDTLCNVIGLGRQWWQVNDNVSLANPTVAFSKTISLNTTEIHNLAAGRIILDDQYSFNGYSTFRTSWRYIEETSSKFRCTLYFTVYPDGLFDSEGLAPYQANSNVLNFSMEFHYDTTGIDSIEVNAFIAFGGESGAQYYQDLTSVFADFETRGSGMTIEETDDPYSDEGTSGEGGGDGGGGGGTVDSVEPAVIPPLPTINVCDLGLITMYNPSEAGVKALSAYLWSQPFDLNTFKKLFGDPMEALIGLAIVPVSPSVGGSQFVKIGNITTDISMPFLSSNWAEVDCGWCSIEKYVGCFMDADPYTKISIYLPFIGIRTLSADDINGGSIHVVYHVDVLTGACAAFIEHSSRGVLYTYNGSCITNVPITSINFSGAIQNAVSAVISGIGVAAGAATGAAPITAMGAMGLLNSAANTAINSKPHIERSGNLGGSAGILSILTPYVIIERPNISVPGGMNKYIGNTSNITFNLNTISGFTMCEYVHIEGCSGTTEEVAEIETLLKQGVYL